MQTKPVLEKLSKASPVASTMENISHDELKETSCRGGKKSFERDESLQGMPNRNIITLSAFKNLHSSSYKSQMREIMEWIMGRAII